jgi:hypothetical protein
VSISFVCSLVSLVLSLVSLVPLVCLLCGLVSLVSLVSLVCSTHTRVCVEQDQPPRPLHPPSWSASKGAAGKGAAASQHSRHTPQPPHLTRPLRHHPAFTLFSTHIPLSCASIPALPSAVCTTLPRCAATCTAQQHTSTATPHTAACANGLLAVSAVCPVPSCLLTGAAPRRPPGLK